jgi:hypothetical protein
MHFGQRPEFLRQPGENISLYGNFASGSKFPVLRELRSGKAREISETLTASVQHLSDGGRKGKGKVNRFSYSGPYPKLDFAHFERQFK